MRNVRADKMLHALLGIALCALAIPVLGGCTGIEPTDLSLIQVGTARDSVEKILGQPVESTTSEVGKIDTYEYNRGRPPQDGGEGNIIGSAISLPPLILLYPIVREDIYGTQRGKIYILYGPDDTVLWLERFPGKIEEARKFLARAEQGDAEAHFRLALLSSSADERGKWLCLAANQGHENAQITLGVKKEFRSEPYERDHAGAYVWYSLAMAQGNDWAAQIRDRVANKMTPAQIAEAKRLAAEWKPGDCGAEDRTAKSTK